MSASTFATAVAWRQAHPRAWELFVEWMQRDVSERRRVSPKFYAECLRRVDLFVLDPTLSPYKVPNEIVSILSRFVWHERPDLRPFLNLHRSEWDVVGAQDSLVVPEPWTDFRRWDQTGEDA